jgi:hypothetical protein
MKPLTSTRRIGAACEAAQNSPLRQPLLPATSIVRFESDRQKFVSATQPVALHWL